MYMLGFYSFSAPMVDSPRYSSFLLAVPSCRTTFFASAGINFIDAQPRERLGELAFDYIREEGAVRSLAGAVEGGNDR